MTTSTTSPILGESFAPRWLDPLAASGYRLRRAWPRGMDHLLLEVVTPHGERVAGQWFGDQERARHIVGRTTGATLVGQVVLQPHGADRKLHPLASLVAEPGHRLVAHRPERRAVVEGERGYIKVMRPEKFAAVAAGARLAHGLGIGAPEVLHEDPAVGILETRTLPGVPLAELLGTDAAESSCFRAGETAARLHAVSIPEDIELPVHGAAQEAQVLNTWKRRATHFTARTFHEPAPDLPDPEATQACLLHRDLHDGQMIFDTDHDGILDLDLMAVGHPALDVGNLLAHLELRHEQGLMRIDVDTAERAVLEGYRPSPVVMRALPAYREAARQRLQAVYSLRNAELAS
ncbi:phosphotransferase [Galactobacter sp.]|uniref:phosphotransferase family protein n=1 Tax=Galactobacter sp. TaxID=2676125 RepID=UPI0025B88A8D|nr:phosphotransferase [Galactobacter sp.]